MTETGYIVADVNAAICMSWTRSWLCWLRHDSLRCERCLSERRVHCVYLNLYKSKYSTINIKFYHLNFKKFHPHVQNNLRNCVQHKKPNKQTNKGRMVLTHFICSVNMIVCLRFTWVCDHGYRYGYNAMGMGTSPACQEVTGTGLRPHPWV